MFNLPQDLVKQIAAIPDNQLDELILLVTRRFHQLRPEQEGVFVALSQDPQKRDDELKNLVQSLRLPKTRP